MSPRRPGSTTLTLLAAIRDGDAYGLDLVERTGLSSGTVYPVLGRLRRRGWIDGVWEDQAVADREGRPRRKYYRLTTAGAAVLDEELARIGALARGARA
ncbi:MAG: PadR family transcriptional regulator [Longimicrobiales bacterium]